MRISHPTTASMLEARTLALSSSTARDLVAHDPPGFPINAGERFRTAHAAIQAPLSLEDHRHWKQHPPVGPRLDAGRREDPPRRAIHAVPVFDGRGLEAGGFPATCASN